MQTIQTSKYSYTCVWLNHDYIPLISMNSYSEDVYPHHIEKDVDMRSKLGSSTEAIRS